jgi:hypothetical protein
MHPLKLLARLLGVFFLPTTTVLGYSLVGSTATLDIRSPDSNTIIHSAGSKIVSAEIEYPSSLIFGDWSSDIGSSTIRLNYITPLVNIVGPAEFNGFVYTFTGASPIANATVDALSTLPVTSLTFDQNVVRVNYADTRFRGPLFTLVNLQFVPEPSALVLGCLASVGLIYCRNRGRIDARN